jgi:hypothetical protein
MLSSRLTPVPPPSRSTKVSGNLHAAKVLTFDQAAQIGREDETPAIISAPSNEHEKINMPAEEAAE